MPINSKRNLLFLLLLTLTNVLFCQTGQIRIKFIGNCGLHLTDGKSNVYIDFPYKSGAYHYMTYNTTEVDSIQPNSILLFTHTHADHYSKKAVRKAKKSHQVTAYGSWNVKKMGDMNAAIDDFKIEAFKTKHRFTFKHYSYLITWHDKRIFLSGDTESGNLIASIQNLDWAFIPYWILLDCKDKNLKIDTKKYGLYHLYPNQKFTNSSPDKILPLSKQGEIITITYWQANL